jgi:hypothetical protein
MDDGTTVTVFGAGVSRHCGFPLADDFFPGASAFGESLGEKCPQLRRVIEHVVKRAQELECLTPDDLALRMYQTRVGDGRQATIDTLYYARIVTDAFFLHLERQVSGSMMRAFQEYWHEVVGSYTQNWRAGMPATKHRLVTFNYDRVAELAFLRFFPEIANNGIDLYGPGMLNTGFSGWRSGLKFEDRTFCYLKLHGTAGVKPFGADEYATAFGDHFGHYASLGDAKFEITDELYFEGPAQENSLPKWKLAPLIAFPVDKQYVESGGFEYSFKNYIGAVGAKARQVFSQAERIDIIGYSFRAPDREWLVALLANAPQADKVVINPHAKQICEGLSRRDGITKLTAIERRWGE